VSAHSIRGSATLVGTVDLLVILAAEAPSVVELTVLTIPPVKIPAGRMAILGAAPLQAPCPVKVAGASLEAADAAVGAKVTAAVAVAVIPVVAEAAVVIPGEAAAVVAAVTANAETQCSGFKSRVIKSRTA